MDPTIAHHNGQPRRIISEAEYRLWQHKLAESYRPHHRPGVFRRMLTSVASLLRRREQTRPAVAHTASARRQTQTIAPVTK